jgi:steroid delta-isomerase-like uncharacterized protein
MAMAQEDAVESNVALMRELFDRLSEGDVDAALARMREDFVINLAGLPQQLHGRDVWRQGMQVMQDAFPDLKVEVLEMFGAGDRVAVRAVLSGRHDGDFQGVPATGRQVAYTSHEFYRIESGMVAEEWICSDMMSLMQQIAP